MKTCGLQVPRRAPVFVTCPCHLPIWIAVLAGTSAGAFLGEHWGLAALALTGLFVASALAAMRAFSSKG